MKNIYYFKGDMKISGSADAGKELEIKNFIPKGAVIRNSKDVYVCIVYTGLDTKLAQNLGKYQFKVSKLQKVTNKFVVINIISLVIFDLFFSQVFHRLWHNSAIDDPSTPKLEENHYYIFNDGNYDKNVSSLNAILTYYLLFNGFLPLNLTVLNALAKFMYVYLMSVDP